jgi:hypothetical protein
VKELTISAAAKALDHCVERVYRQHVSFRLRKRGVTYALLVPADFPGCDTHDFADDLGQAKLSLEDRRSFRESIRRGHKALKRLKNPWG